MSSVERSARYRAAHPEKIRAASAAYRLARSEDLVRGEYEYCYRGDAHRDRGLTAPEYRLTAPEYRQLFEAQGGVCAICRQPETKVGRRSGRVYALAIDHDHATGFRRGLLCDRCNRVIGFMWDNPVLLVAAAAYLQKGSL